MKRANTAVAAAFKAYKLKHPNATKADVKQWVESALDLDTGFAFWETPPTRQVRNVNGWSQPLFANTISNLLASDRAWQPPLNICAVHIRAAFEGYS